VTKGIFGPPELREMRCVHYGLLSQGAFIERKRDNEGFIWADKGSQSSSHCSIWRVYCGNNQGVPAGTFITSSTYEQPPSPTIAFCLN